MCIRDSSCTVVACGSSDDSGAAYAGSAGSGDGHPEAGDSARGGAATGSAGYTATGGDSAAGDTSTAGAAGSTDAAGAAGAPETSAETQYVADLEGYSQSPRVNTSATGAAELTLSADKKTLSYHITQSVVGATKAHIHLGAAGENGAVVYPLAPLSADMKGTITLAGATDVANLDSGNFYINVHSATNADGEIRGQILHPNETLYVANLTPAQETPPITATSSGTAQLIVAADKKGFRYHVLSTITAATAAHIHQGLAGRAGAIVHPFVAGPTIDGQSDFAPGEANDLAQGRWYVNVHTAAHAAGEIRGQLMLPGETLYSAALSDAAETPPVTSGGTGNAQFILAPDQKSIRYELALFGITPTLAHIHKGALGVAGPVVYPLALQTGYANIPTASAGAFGEQAISAADLTDLEAGTWYANAHTTAFPMGATRGQISLTP